MFNTSHGCYILNYFYIANISLFHRPPLRVQLGTMWTPYDGCLALNSKHILLIFLPANYASSNINSYTRAWWPKIKRTNYDAISILFSYKIGCCFVDSTGKKKGRWKQDDGPIAIKAMCNFRFLLPAARFAPASIVECCWTATPAPRRPNKITKMALKRFYTLSVWIQCV